MGLRLAEKRGSFEAYETKAKLVTEMPHHQAEPISIRLFTPGMLVLIGLAAMGAAAASYRLLFGLGAATNLDTQHPWGIWIAIDVATGVALAAGGFTTAALTHIFHRRRFEPVVRPALLTAVLGYTFVVLGLMMDLGRYYNIWHPMLPIMWQGNSVLFEVGMCVMVYLNVLYLEFAPLVCERFIGNVNLPGPLAGLNEPVDLLLRFAQGILGKVMFLFIIAGVVLSCMHQSSLGALLLIAPYKMNPLWYTPILPLLFLLSAIAVGFPMVIFESLLASWTLRRRAEMEILTPLSKFVIVFLGIYGGAKISDMLIRESYVHLFNGTPSSLMFMLEMLIGVFIPFGMLLSERVRRSKPLLFIASALIILGVALNRINVFLVAYTPPYATKTYFPSALEVLMTIGLISALILAYRILVGILPVLPAAGTTARRVAKMGLIIAVGGVVFLVAQTAYAAESMPDKVETGGDCSTCHSTNNPSKNDLKTNKCSRQRKNPSGKIEGTPPDFFILDQLSDLYVPVVFPHRLHAEMESMAGACETCHHHGEPGKAEACRTCHASGGNNPNNLRQPGLKGAYHRQCLACHREWNHESDCVFCHAKRAVGNQPPPPQDPGDVLGRLHPNVVTPEKWIYPTETYEAGTMVTFLHKEHVDLFGKRCVNCHKKENCSRCHDGDAGPQKHVRQDPHEDCSRCHDISGDCTQCHMKQESPGFDHGKRGGFMLKLYHKGVACQKCHTDQNKYAGLKKDCTSCHPADWAPAAFDHAKSGIVALDKNHAETDCSGCHADGLGKPTKCATCHDEGWKFPDKVPGTLLSGSDPATAEKK